MPELAHVEIEVTFIPSSEGGRAIWPAMFTGGGYRPHLVLGDPNQRQAIMEGNYILETYLAIAFWQGPDRVEEGVPFICDVVLMGYHHPCYDGVRPGATFTVREGAKIVGYGVVNEGVAIRAT